MTETKTFKNPYDVNTMVSGHEPSVVTHSVEGNKFRSSDWDMEVTFTSKPIQFPAGLRVRSKYLATYIYTVIGQYKDKVVVVDETDDEIEIFDDDDLVIV